MQDTTKLSSVILPTFSKYFKLIMSFKRNVYEDFLISYLQNASKLALFLDYDGTLTPLVDHPDLAKIPDDTKALLEKLSLNSKIFLAIISGRSAENVKDIVGLQNLVYAGNHGLEVIYPDGSKYNHDLPNNFKEKSKEVVAKLEKKLLTNGAWIEDKKVSLTFHYRAVPENLHSEFEKEAERIIEEAGLKVSYKCYYFF